MWTPPLHGIQSGVRLVEPNPSAEFILSLVEGLGMNSVEGCILPAQAGQGAKPKDAVGELSPAAPSTSASLAARVIHI